MLSNKPFMVAPSAEPRDLCTTATGAYLSIRYTERLAEAGIGLFKAEVIRRGGPWRNLEDVEYATLEWVGWFNTRRLLEPIGHMPPVEYEEAYYYRQEAPVLLAAVT